MKETIATAVAIPLNLSDVVFIVFNLFFTGHEAIISFLFANSFYSVEAILSFLLFNFPFTG